MGLVTKACEEFTGRPVSATVALLAMIVMGLLHYVISDEVARTHERLDALEAGRETIREKADDFRSGMGVLHTDMKNLEKKVDKLDEKLEKLRDAIYKAKWENGQK